MLLTLGIITDVPFIPEMGKAVAEVVSEIQPTSLYGNVVHGSKENMSWFIVVPIPLECMRISVTFG